MVIPKSMQKGILKLLHCNHSGVVKMKQLARRSVYWFNINADIESYVRYCDPCNRMMLTPKEKVDTKWIPTTRPFCRIHADFFYLNQKVFLVIVDSFSKWIELEWMKYGTDAEKVIRKFVALFARFGFPDVVVTDGGPPFNGHAFVTFLEKQGIKVMKSPPYHPASNGQAERSVKLVKEVLKKFLLDKNVMSLQTEDQINLFLINYRISCLTKEGMFPSEKVLNYTPKTMIDLINPKKAYRPKTKDDCTNDNLGVNSRKAGNPTGPITATDPIFRLKAGETIWYKNNNSKDFTRWIEAKFVRSCSPTVFQILIGSVVAKAHRGQLRVPKTVTQPASLNLTTPCRRNNKRSRSLSNEEEFLGYEEDGLAARKRLRALEVEKEAVGNEGVTTPVVRRSQRLLEKLIQPKSFSNTSDDKRRRTRSS